MADKGEPKHNNELDIGLAYRTLVLLGELAEQSLLPPKPDVRSLAANLCLYQDHWATPIFNPMLGRKEFDKPLPTPRPLSVLERLQCVVPVDAKDLATTHAEGEPAPWKGVVDEGGKKYVVVGGKVWKQLVDGGKITGDAAKSAEITVFSWLKELFEFIHVFYSLGQAGGDDKKEDDGKGKSKGKSKSPAKGKGKGKGKGKEEEGEAKEDGEEVGTVDKLKETARDLAACWYYTATEVDFDEEEGDSDDEEEEGDEGDDEEEDEDEDEDEDEEEDEGEEEEQGADDKEKKDEKPAEAKDGQEKDASTSERSPKRLKPDTPTKDKETKEPIAGGSTPKKEGETQATSSSGKVTFKDLPASLKDDDDDEEDYDEEDDEEFDPDEANDEDDDYIDEDDEEGEGEDEESQSTKRIREAIMQGVESLGAYIPNPATDPVFFKRMVVKMRTVEAEAPEEYAQLWFPLGTDPNIFLNIQK